VRKSALVALAILLIPSVAQAKVSSITRAQPLVQGRFSDGAGDQVSALLSDANGFIAVGTVEGAPGDWLPNPALGGTDGFLTHFSFAGLPTWTMRLGSASDEIATAATIAKSGEIWVVGASATQNELTSLTVWEISAVGALLNTFQLQTPSIIYPHSIAESGAGFTITGDDFTTAISASGTFAPLKRAKPSPAKVTKLISFKGTTYSWRIYTGKGPLIGIPTFHPKVAQTIYYKVLNSNTTVKVAYQTATPPLFARYQKDIGIALISESNAGFALSLLK